MYDGCCKPQLARQLMGCDSKFTAVTRGRKTLRYHVLFPTHKPIDDTTGRLVVVGIYVRKNAGHMLGKSLVARAVPVSNDN